MVKDKEKWNAYKRQYYATHPEARRKRDEYTKQWRSVPENRDKWNEYMREYQRQRRMEKAKEKLKEDGFV
jgi:hypothetical protein